MGKQDLRMRLENGSDVLLQSIAFEMCVQKYTVYAKLGIKVVVEIYES